MRRTGIGIESTQKPSDGSGSMREELYLDLRGIGRLGPQFRAENLGGIRSGSRARDSEKKRRRRKEKISSTRTEYRPVLVSTEQLTSMAHRCLLVILLLLSESHSSFGRINGAVCDREEDPSTAVPLDLSTTAELDPAVRRHLESLTAKTQEMQMLLEFQRGISGDPMGVLASWNMSVQPEICHWAGISCDLGSGRVVALNLTGRLLEGSISPSIGGLAALSTLDLSYNEFAGAIPPTLGLLRSLKVLDLSHNQLTGTIPRELSNCTSVTHFDLSNNLLEGSIPAELGSLLSLEMFLLQNNDLTSAIPTWLANCAFLTAINLGENKLAGSVPAELGALRELQNLLLSGNNLSGPIPASISRCGNLRILDLNSNALSGPIPPELGLLVNLRVLRLDENNLSGSIPASLGDCTQLTELMLGDNPLTGRIPEEFGRLALLGSFVITGSFIHGEIPSNLSSCTNLRRLSLFDNLLTGPIPPALGKCENLSVLELANNRLTGEIPSSLASLRSLGRLDVRENQLNGSVPSAIGRLKSLVELLLASNRLSGPVSPEIGQLRKLEKLDLSDNDFWGEIPPNLSRCSSLRELNLSYNNLSGPIAGHLISGLRAMSYLNLENNAFSGPIPHELGTLEFIVAIDLSSNSLSGEIPSSLGNCHGLMLLNLSNNHLTGELPSSLAPLQILTVFSVANNDLRGAVPKLGLFANMSSASFSGNPQLCGPIVHRNCASGSGTDSDCADMKCHRRWVYVVSGASGFLLALAALLVYWWCNGGRMQRSGARRLASERMRMRKEVRVCAHASQARMKVTAEDLWAATEGFSETNILGVGGYSTVYKGVLPGGMAIAVKRLNLDMKDLSDEHLDVAHELQMLRGLRHKNLLKVYGFCATVELKALVMEFIPNGSLHVQLHKGEVCALSWETRLKIAINVADAMIHLHHECHEPIVHRDLKPSNILLDPDFNARVADFGIAKYVHFDNSNGETTASGLYGTTGYIAPEYVTSNKVSTKGDVYSYGVVLLEMLTRKQPTDESFTPGQWLSLWVLKAFPDRIPEILDASLESVYKSNEDEVHMLIRIGLLCTRELPNDRPTMKEVREMLNEVMHPGRGSFSTNNYPSMAELADIHNGLYGML